MKVIITFHQGTLRVAGASRGLIEEVCGGVPLVWDDRDDIWRCDAMWAQMLGRRLSDNHVGSVVWELSPEGQSIRIPDKRSVKLREDQVAAVDAFQTGGRCGLVIMPTGTGKTVVAIDLIVRAQCSVLVVVPVRDLMYQWHDKLREATGIDAGLIGDGIHRVSPISVTTYDSAAIHMPRIGDRFGMIVFDEVHHLPSTFRSDAARMSPAAFRLGLTATLPTDNERLRLLHQLVGPTLYQQSIAGAAGKTLAEYTVRRIAVRMNDDEAKRYRELSKTVQSFVREQRELEPTFRWEHVYKLSAAANDNPERALEATRATKAFRMKRQIEERAEGKMRLLEDLFRLHAGEQVIVFTGSNAMARDLSKRFLVPCLLSHCAKRERRLWLEGFSSGRFPVLIANRVLDEGVDLPEVKTAIVLGGMSSQRQAIQRLGRVLRRGQGDRLATLYEVVTEDTNEVNRSRNRRRNQVYRPGRQP